jgi:hypothetical protein
VGPFAATWPLYMRACILQHVHLTCQYTAECVCMQTSGDISNLAPSTRSLIAGAEDSDGWRDHTNTARKQLRNIDADCRAVAVCATRFAGPI